VEEGGEVDEAGLGRRVTGVREGVKTPVWRQREDDKGSLEW